MTIKKIRIFDMDGTVVCSMHRYRTIAGADGVERIDLPFWREHSHLAMSDSLLPLAAKYKADLANPDVFVVIATARVLGEVDRQFIAEVLGQPNHIISRRADDTRSGGLLKVLGLSKLFGLKQLAGVTDRKFYEDNVSYLSTVCNHFGFNGVYIPSKQGH
jgi:hypothetical protein